MTAAHINQINISIREPAEVVQRMRDAGMTVRPASNPFTLPELFVLPALPNGQSMSDWVIESRGPR